MMLTNMLPEGDGEYHFQVVASDWYGKQTMLGKKTVSVKNEGSQGSTKLERVSDLSNAGIQEWIHNAEECFEPVEAIMGYKDATPQEVEWDDNEKRVIEIPELMFD